MSSADRESISRAVRESADFMARPPSAKTAKAGTVAANRPEPPIRRRPSGQSRYGETISASRPSWLAPGRPSTLMPAHDHCAFDTAQRRSPGTTAPPGRSGSRRRRATVDPTAETAASAQAMASFWASPRPPARRALIAWATANASTALGQGSRSESSSSCRNASSPAMLRSYRP